MFIFNSFQHYKICKVIIQLFTVAEKVDLINLLPSSDNNYKLS